MYFSKLFLFKRRSSQHYRSYKNNSHDRLSFQFECVNRLPIRCRRKFLTILGLENHLKKGAVVAQWLWSWFNLKTLCAKGRRFKYPSGHLIQRKFSMKRKNSMIYGPTTKGFHSQPSDTYWARLGKKNRAS